MSNDKINSKKTPTELTIIKGLDSLSSFDLSTIGSDEFNEQYNLLVVSLEQLIELKTQVDEQIKQAIEKDYKETGETSLISGNRKYTYVPATTRVSVDTKRLQSELPEIYTQYARVTQVAPLLRSTIIKKKDKED